MESYVERWKREQAQKAQKSKTRRKKVNGNGRTEKTQGQAEGQHGHKTP